MVENRYVAREASRPQPARSRAALHLPFVDDFSNYSGYPAASLWQDNYAYINRTFALRPPTLGVATLDALDEHGKVYVNADAQGFRADALTSLPIRLDYNFTLNRAMRVSDSLYLSFYYQPAGGSLSGLEWERVGNRPESRDSLVLEFGYATGNIIFVGYEYCDYVIPEGDAHVAGDTLVNPYMANSYYIFDSPVFPGDVISLPCDSIMGEETVWEHVWSTPGELLDDWLEENPLNYFKQVMIPITDDRWLINNFQFRFRNLASLEDNHIVGWASNVDQWHIDYVRLDVNRNANDLYPSDLAFVMPTTSILKNYSAMPWSQYEDSELIDAFDNVLSNLSSSIKNSDYTYTVKKNNTVLGSYTPNNSNAEPYYNHGLHDDPVHTHPPFNVTTLGMDAADSAIITVTHIFQEVGSSDQRRCNDTCVHVQRFSNYFAYDDGSAEAGYSLLSPLTYPEAYFAMKFTVNRPDTLRAVQMWFNSVQEDANLAPFTLMVWSDRDGEPGDVLYENENCLAKHGNQYEDFVNYYLDDEAVEVTGSFYVGFFQNHTVQLNLGFDQNTDSHGKWLYKTSTLWQTSFLKGTPMVRAVVGKPIDHSSVEEQVSEGFSVFPNPATDVLHLVLPEQGNGYRSYRVLDMLGRVVMEGNRIDSCLSISQLRPGLYLLQLSGDRGETVTCKFLRK